MTENKFTLATPEIDKDSVFLIDWSKMEKIEDLILLLASIGFSFSPMHPQFETIKHLLALDRPIKVGGPKPEQKEIQLPKLKMVKKDGE